MKVAVSLLSVGPPITIRLYSSIVIHSHIDGHPSSISMDIIKDTFTVRDKLCMHLTVPS